MLEIDYLLMLSSGILSIKEDRLENAIRMLAENYELQEDQKPGFVSIGGRGEAGIRLNYRDWVHWIRDKRISKLDFYYMSASRPGLPAHIATAFAGAVELLMQVSTAEGEFNFVLLSRSSPAYELTGDLLRKLIDRQSIKDLLWARIHEMVNESNALNNRPAVALKDIKNYISNQEDESAFGLFLPDWIRELQVESDVRGSGFMIPDDYAAYFDKPDSRLGFPDKERVFLYSIKEPDGRELRRLIEAQPFKDQLIEEIRKQPKIPSPLKSKKSSAAEWLLTLENSDAASMQAFAGIVIDTIISICEKKNILPLIPDQLSETFAPNELDQRRARARMKIKSRWYLKINEHPWRSYLFERVPDDAFKKPAAGANDAGKHFFSLLAEIESFAFKIGSPFAETFRLAAFVLTPDFSAVHFTEHEWKSLKTLLRSKQFTDRAIEMAEGHFQYAIKMKQLGWNTESLKGLLAFLCSNVFGGMGSWNDFFPDDPTDKETYSRLSAGFFQAEKEYFTSLLSVTC